MNHPDADLLKLGQDLDLLLQADALLQGCDDFRNQHAANGRAVKTMKAIHRLSPSTIEGVAVKLRAICFDFADFHVEKMSLTGGDVAERELGRLMRHLQRVAGRASP